MAGHELLEDMFSQYTHLPPSDQALSLLSPLGSSTAAFDVFGNNRFLGLANAVKHLPAWTEIGGSVQGYDAFVGLDGPTLHDMSEQLGSDHPHKPSTTDGRITSSVPRAAATMHPGFSNLQSLELNNQAHGQMQQSASVSKDPSAQLPALANVGQTQAQIYSSPFSQGSSRQSPVPIESKRKAEGEDFPLSANDNTLRKRIKAPKGVPEYFCSVFAVSSDRPLEPEVVSMTKRTRGKKTCLRCQDQRLKVRPTRVACDGLMP
jgi:hypothetical protein